MTKTLNLIRRHAGKPGAVERAAAALAARGAPDKAPLAMLGAPSEHMSPVQLAEYREALRETQEALAKDLPENTRLAYARDFRHFERWCGDVKFQALPANDEAMTGYITHLAFGEGLKPTTIMRRLFGIAHRHRDAGHESPVTQDVRRHLRQVRRRPEVDTSRKQAPPLLVEDLKVLVSAMNSCPGPLREIALRDKAILLLGWSCALRRSEIVGLELRDIIERRGEHLVRIGRSKTDQEGEGIELPLNYAKKRPDLCTITALTAWLKLRGDADGALFWRVSELIDQKVLTGGRVVPGDPMPWVQVNRMLTWWQLIAKLEAPEGRRFSPHSLRAGYITETALAGELPNVIMARSRHKTLSVFSQYIRVALDHKNDPTRSVL